MPELPEVETTRIGLLPKVRGQRIASVIVRDKRLRWPIPDDFAAQLEGSTVNDILRRGKYLLWECVKKEPPRKERPHGFILSHLGMSGTLCVLPASTPSSKHDHIDIVLSNQLLIRFNDPRRFGAMLWIPAQRGLEALETPEAPETSHPSHPLLDILGPEPLSAAFTAAHLFKLSRGKGSRGRTVSIKEFIMNGHVVVGVGNIYASESLFRAGIHPKREAGKVSIARYEKLADAIRETLSDAIRAGGTSLRDYVKTDGEKGYFQLDAAVYGREGKACRICQTPIRSIVQGARSTYFCPHCQH